MTHRWMRHVAAQRVAGALLGLAVLAGCEAHDASAYDSDAAPPSGDAPFPVGDAGPGAGARDATPADDTSDAAPKDAQVDDSDADAPSPEPGAPAFSAPGRLIEPQVDANVSPCTDFYAYACSPWLAAHADAEKVSVLSELAERDRPALAELFAEYAAEPAHPDPVKRLLGAYYAACLDEAAAAEQGYAPLAPIHAVIDALGNASALPEAAAQLAQLGAPALFAFAALPDPQAADTLALWLGILPPAPLRFVLDAAPAGDDVRAQLLTLMTLTAGRAGYDVLRVPAVYEIFTTLIAATPAPAVAAKGGTPSRVSRAELEALAPGLDFRAMFTRLGLAPDAVLVSNALGQLSTLATIARARSLDDLKAYLHFIVHLRMSPYVDDAPSTPDALSALLFGPPAESREAFCVTRTWEDLAPAVGAVYGPSLTDADRSALVQRFVEELRGSMRDALGRASFLDSASRTEGLSKLAAMVAHTGGDARFPLAASITLEGTSLLAAAVSLQRAALARELALVGAPSSEGAPCAPPADVSACYYPLDNSIVITPAIARGHMFAPDAELAANYGALGVVIGHELTHGFDNQGRGYDASGNLRDWWSPASRAAFDARTSCLVDEYGRFVALDDPSYGGRRVVDGLATLGESVADLGGVRLAYAAFTRALSRVGAPGEASRFTPQQRFFLAFAQNFCNVLPAATRWQFLSIDPHSPGRLRVHGVVRNLPEFPQAFSCAEGAPMVRTEAERCSASVRASSLGGEP